MKRKIIQSVSQVTLIVLLVLCFLYPDEVLTFSYSYLGKFIAIIFVVLVTCVNVVYGAFLCALLILYYQSDMVEGMVLYESTTMVPIRAESQVTTQNGEVVENKNKNNKKKKNESEILDFVLDPPDPDFVIDIENTGLGEHFSYTAKDNFRKKYCSSGHLRGDINERIFRHEFTDAILPGFEFRFENRCNPCDPNCDFSFSNGS